MSKRSTRFLVFASSTALMVSLVSCSTPNQANNPTTATKVSPQASPSTLALTQEVMLNGSGASFPAPLYQRWFHDLNQRNPNLKVNYLSVGSGAGVEQFTKKTVDFGASDVAMTDEEIAAVNGDVLMLPMTAGSVVLAYNIPGVQGELKLPREVYTDIFLGKITNWNDPAIAKANPTLTLPNLPITVVHRSDGSGTTGVFTQHLSAISPVWKQQVGSGKNVNWPTGIGAQGNEGVTAQIQQNEGAIGYVEYGYAKENGLRMATLQNKAGNFVKPSEQSAEKALEGVHLPNNLRAFIPDPEGANSYPIVTYSWMLVRKHYNNPDQAKAIEAMIEYGLTKGQDESTQLGYVPLPHRVKEQVAAVAQEISPDYHLALK
jgi:phosphate transport system substrate-binding protein